MQIRRHKVFGTGANFFGFYTNFRHFHANFTRILLLFFYKVATNGSQ